MIDFAQKQERDRRREALWPVLAWQDQLELRAARYLGCDAPEFVELLDALEAKYAEALREHRIEQRRRRVRSFNMPLTDADVNALALGALEETHTLVAARKWWASDTPLLVLLGSPGIGKTLAASALLFEHGGTYARALEVARLFAAQFGDEIDDRQKLIDCAGLLVLDDIGTERSLEAMQAALFELLDARRRDRRRSIWVANLTRAAFEERYADPRLLSRMAAAASWFAHGGEDMRRPKP